MTVYPKHLTISSTGRRLSVEEMMRNLLTNSDEYATSDISIRNMTPAEILKAVKEFWFRQVLGSPHSRGLEDLQQTAWSALDHWPEGEKLHKWKHPQAVIGPEWLKSGICNSPFSSF